jgi:F-box/WD-40 domain protein 5
METSSNQDNFSNSQSEEDELSDSENICGSCNMNQNNRQLTDFDYDGHGNSEKTAEEEREGAGYESKWSPSCSAKTKDSRPSIPAAEDASLKNLIFVTGEFAVALHQLGIKNVSTETLSKQTSSAGDQEVSEMEVDVENHHMVVNFSNNDIHVQPYRKSDKPDHLIDLFGHVTGLCLSRDNRQVFKRNFKIIFAKMLISMTIVTLYYMPFLHLHCRYLFLNYRPWIGKVDRNDPWATPDLSPCIEVLVIDLLTLKNEGVRYVGHKGYSPSTMCCFVFLDVSHDYVGR